MKLVTFSVLLILGAVSSAPTSKEDALVITDEFFPGELKIYEGEHDITKIFVPLNGLNFEEDSSSSEEEGIENLIFFVEADVKDGKTTDQGLYVKKGHHVKKLLDHGRDIAATFDESKTAYFAAKDGLYKYNPKEKTAEKYGNIDDDLIGVLVTNVTKTIYVLTANKEVYKLSEDGTKKVKVDDIKNAEQIVADFNDNLYYVDSNKKLYVVNTDGVKVIEGLPENFSKITLIRPPFVLENCIPVLVDKSAYTVYVNGTVEKEEITVDSEITAISMDAALIQYYGHNKNIYQYNILALLIGKLLEELREFLNGMKNEIEHVASRTRNQINAGRF